MTAGPAGPAAPAARTAVEAGGRHDRHDRILDAFETRAAAGGIRSVVMADLARDLTMSTKTLYREFPTKAALVEAMVQRWASRFGEAVAAATEAPGAPPVERLRAGVQVAAMWRDRIGADFWQELRAEHPDLWKRCLDAVDAERRLMRTVLRDELRDDVEPLLAAPLLRAMVERSTSAEVRATTAMTLTEAVDAAVDLWARAVLR